MGGCRGACANAPPEASAHAAASPSWKCCVNRRFSSWCGCWPWSECSMRPHCRRQGDNSVTECSPARPWNHHQDVERWSLHGAALLQTGQDRSIPAAWIDTIYYVTMQGKIGEDKAYQLSGIFASTGTGVVNGVSNRYYSLSQSGD